MDHLVTVRVLRGRRNALADEIAAMEVDLAYRRSTLANLDAVLLSLDPDYKPEGKARQRRKAAKLFRPGQRCQAILTVLRAAKGRPMALKEVVAGVLQNGGVVSGESAAVEKRTRDGLIYLASEERITKIGNGTEARWTTAPADRHRL
jgi:hypothetical protein